MGGNFIFHSYSNYGTRKYLTNYCSTGFFAHLLYTVPRLRYSFFKHGNTGNARIPCMSSLHKKGEKKWSKFLGSREGKLGNLIKTNSNYAPVLIKCTITAKQQIKEFFI